MLYKNPNKITHNGVKLSERLEAHTLWIKSGGSSGKRLDLRGRG